MSGITPARYSLSSADWRITAPGITTGPSYPDCRIVDSGLRFQPRGSLALYTNAGYETLGVACPNCPAVTTNIRPWSCCQNCGELLLEMDSATLPPQAMRVDWSTGTAVAVSTLTTVMSLPSVAPVESERTLPNVRDRSATKRNQGSTEPDRMSTECNRESAEPGRITTDSTRTAPSFGERVLQRASRGRGRGLLRTQIDPASQPDDTQRSTATSEAGKPTMGKGDGTQASGTVTQHPDLVPAEECSTESHSSIESDRFSDQWDSVSFPGCWSDDQGDQKQDLDIANAVATSSPAAAGDPPATQLLPLHSPAEPPGGTVAAMSRLSMGRPPTPEHVAGIPVVKSPDSCIPPGYGHPKALPKLARLQRVVLKKVAQEYGLLYPYVPKAVMQEISAKRLDWYGEAVGDYLGTTADMAFMYYRRQFESCLENWSYGRHIYANRVIIRRPRHLDVPYFVTTVDKDGETVQLPDPAYYW